MPSDPIKPFLFVFYLQINSAPEKQKRERNSKEERLHTSTGELAPPEAPPRSHTSTGSSHTTMSSDPHPSYPKKHNPIPISANPHPPDLAPPKAPSRSHPWPTHAWSLSFLIYLSLSLTCWSLSLPPSLRLTEFLNCGNVLFRFLFGFCLF